jgi:hypothetical protein
MAGAGFKDFTAGDILRANDVDQFLMHQSVMRFTTTSAADTALGATKAEGMIIYATSTDTLHAYNGAAWVPFATALGSGTGYMGAWTGYTPTLTGITLGNGSVSFTFVQQGKTVHVRGRVTFGSTTAVTGAASISLPVTATAANFVANLTARAGGVDYAMLPIATTTTIGVNALGSAATYANRVTVSNLIPGTWTTSDFITMSATYEAA